MIRDLYALARDHVEPETPTSSRRPLRAAYRAEIAAARGASRPITIYVAGRVLRAMPDGTVQVFDRKGARA